MEEKVTIRFCVSTNKVGSESSMIINIEREEWDSMDDDERSQLLEDTIFGNCMVDMWYEEE